MYDFEPEKDEITLIKVTKGQALRVVQVSGEWWYVEDRMGNRGYVPATYLRPYQPVPSVISEQTFNETIKKTNFAQNVTHLCTALCRKLPNLKCTLNGHPLFKTTLSLLRGQSDDDFHVFVSRAILRFGWFTIDSAIEFEDIYQELYTKC